MLRYKYLLLLGLVFLLIPSAAMAVKMRHIYSVYTDETGEPLTLPEGVGCSLSGEPRAVIADTGNNRVLLYSFEKGVLQELQNLKLKVLSNPIKVAIDTRGRVLVLDGKKRRIGRLNDNGEFDRYIDAKGMPAPDTVVPRSFALDRKDNIYLLDIFGERVLVLDSEGKFLRQIAFPEEYGFISDVAVNANGDVLLIDTVASEVFLSQGDAEGFSALAEETMKETVKFPTSLTTDGRKSIYVIDKHKGSIAVVGANGDILGHKLSAGRDDGLLWFPTGACVSNNGYLFIADKSNHRVQIFELLE